MLWRNCLYVTICKTHPQFILLNMSDTYNKKWMMPMVYGSPTKKLREKLWNDLGRAKCGIEDPLIAVGDFNAVTCMDEVSNAEMYIA